MSDLISREKIRDYIKVEINPYGKPFEGTAYELGLKIMRYIDAMDSYYDLDKVVEELEEMIHPKQLYFCKYARGGCKHLYNNDKDCMECIVENAIEIVKRGGASDDVCVWKFEETNGIAWHCNDKCTTYNQVYIKDLKITLEDFECKCPYCGKNIKVVDR